MKLLFKLCVVSALLLVFFCASTQVTAVTCNPTELSPCAGAISGAGAPPSAACCSKLKQQQPCLCGYLKNPTLRGYINSPNGRKVGQACGVPFPNC